MDDSPLYVKQASVYNKDAVAAGRCTVQHGDASDLPSDCETFDLATAFETVCFWPGLEK